MNLSTDNLVLAPDAPIDLHLHTIFSDGKWLPDQLLDHLAKERFALAAITDHDRPDTAAALQQLAKDRHQPILIGVEMTTVWQDELAGQRVDELSGLPEMTDLLCFGFDPDRTALRDLARDLHRRQSENSREVFENLVRQGYRFPDSSNALTAILDKTVQEQPFGLADLLAKNGYGTGEPSVGRILLEAGCTNAMNDLAEVVQAAHRDGGVCLIAHPGHKDGFVTYDTELLDKLRQEIPIDGLEVYSPKHTPEQTGMYREYAERHHLLVSAGSDSHRPEKPPIGYQAGLCRALLERVGVRVG